MRETNTSFLSKFTSVDMSASFNGPNIGLDSIYGFAIGVVWTGSPVGNIKLQASVDPLALVGGPIHWDDIPDSTVPVSGAGSEIWNFNGSFYEWVRVVWVSTSGTGTLTVCNVKLKGV